MEPRLTKIRKILAEKNADVFWLPNHEKSGQPSTQYLSGFTGSESHLLVTKNKAWLVTDGRYITSAKKEVSGCEIVDVAKYPVSGLFKKILPKSGKKRVLIDGKSVSVFTLGKLKENVAGVKIVDEGGLLAELRRVKTPEEIKLLQKAADIACRAFGKFLPFVKAGVTEKWLARKLTDLLLDGGAEGAAFPPIIASGRNGALPHATPSDKKLKNGELVVIDFGAVYQGYVSDMTRTVAIGKISSRLQEMYEAVREAQAKGCKAARAGITGHDLDAICRNSLTKNGLGEYFTHSTGHGIGMEVHELPNISPKQTAPLKVGEVITCEPGVYVPNVGGVRIEDSLAITKEGAINLTNGVEKKLIVL